MPRVRKLQPVARVTDLYNQFEDEVHGLHPSKITYKKPQIVGGLSSPLNPLFAYAFMSRQPMQVYDGLVPHVDGYSDSFTNPSIKETFLHSRINIQESIHRYNGIF